MNKNIKTYVLTIKGRVQNVGFRYWFYQEAIKLELRGYVKNLNNESEVESLVQGLSNKILHIIKKSKIGPESAIVKKIESKEIVTNTIYNKFLIR